MITSPIFRSRHFFLETLFNYKKALDFSGALKQKKAVTLNCDNFSKNIIKVHLDRKMVRTEVRHLKAGDIQPPLQKGQLRLYSMRFCPYAQRVHLVLDFKKVKYDVVNVDLVTKPEWLFEKNPDGKVPAIEFEDGDTLYESLILSDYLDERYPEPPLYPKDPLAKAKDKLLMEKFNKVIRSIYKMLLHDSFNAETMDDVKSGLDLFEKEMQKRQTKYLGGDKPGMLDLMIWPWCERADILKIIGGEVYKLPADRFPRILEWRINMIAEESVRISYLDPETHAKHFLSRQAGYPDYDLLIKSKQ